MIRKSEQGMVKIVPRYGETTDYLGRFTCKVCGRLAPRGHDRPYCEDHGPHAKKVREEIERMGEVA